MPPQKTRHSYHFQGRNLPDLAGWTNSDWKGEEDRFAPTTARLTIDWLEGNYRFNPFFLWVDFFDPHEPWDPPEYMVSKYDDNGGQPMIHPNYGWSTDLSDAELHNLRAHYAAEVQMVDRWIGRVFQKLDDLDLWSNSIVLFTSDHGISLGEHERTGKSNISPNDDRCWPLYPEIAKVPWLVAAPGLEGGCEVDLLMQPPDTLPTILELAGVEATPPDPFHGVSVAPQLRGESWDDIHDFVITAGHLRGGEGSPPSSFTTSVGWVTPMLYTKQWAYAPIGANVDPELYDLTADPTAETDVATRHPDVVGSCTKSS